MASIHTPVRQPFGVLDGTKLRNLQSIKNRQNAVTQSALSLKRGRVSPDVSDSENVDPIQHQFKRKRMGNDNDLIKSSPMPAKTILKPILKPRSRISTSSLPIPKTPTTTMTPPAVSSAPCAANRSPSKSKRPGILSTHRTRLNAPSLGSRSRSTLSLSAALQGTLAHKKASAKAKKPLTSDKPNSWFFDIYEDRPEEEKSSFQLWHAIGGADALDISDSEGPVGQSTPSTPYDEAETNKENIAPDAAFLPAPTARIPAISRKDMMTDDPRSPLADLRPADYYGKGCDATSVALVADEDPPVLESVVLEQAQQLQPTQAVVEAPSSANFDFLAPLPTTIVTESSLATQSLSSLLQAVAPVPVSAAAEETPKQAQVPDPEAGLFGHVVDGAVGNGDGDGNGESGIEIWESESAKDESEGVEV